MRIHSLHRTCLMLLSCLGLSLYSVTFAQDFYKWVDQKGTTHYTKTPPPKHAKKQGQVATSGIPRSTPTPSQPPSNSQNSKPAQTNTALPDQQREANEALRQGQQTR